MTKQLTLPGTFQFQPADHGILYAVRTFKPASARALAESASLPVARIEDIVERLMNAGFVEERDGRLHGTVAPQGLAVPPWMRRGATTRPVSK